jgi:DNA recombination protein RmuC
MSLLAMVLLRHNPAALSAKVVRMEPDIELLIIAGLAAGGGLACGLALGMLQGRRAGARLRAGFNRTVAQLREALAGARRHARGVALTLEQARARLGEKERQHRRLQDQLRQLEARYHALRNDHTRLRTVQQEREERHIEQIQLLNEARDNLKRDFENLANRIFEEKGQTFTATSQASLESLLKPFREQINGFQSRINEVHAQSLRGQSALEAEIKKVLDIGLEMNTQAGNLAVALKGDKKTAGNWGEAQLERTLELAGLLPGEHYESQAVFRDETGRRRLPDFLIKLPDDKALVIDSKVSLVDYDRAIAAESDDARAEALAAHARAVRTHIDDLSSKEYANLPGIGSPDFVLMFMPVEPAYIEAMKYNRELFNYGYQKGVVMVSHTTLMPILRTVANLWMVEKGNREAREIADRAGEIYNQVCLLADRLCRLGNTLRAANNHFNDTVRGLAGQQGLHGKVDRFRQLSARANREMPPLEPIHQDLETGRLLAIEAGGGTEAHAALVEVQLPRQGAPRAE